MSEIFAWIRSILFLAVFLTLLMQILPNGSYRKYVRFFAGMVFVITVLGPVAELFGSGDWQQRILSGLLYKEKQQEGELDFGYMEERQKEYYAEGLASAVREIASQAASDLGLQVRDVYLEREKESGEIQSVTVWTDAGSETALQELRERLAGLLSLEKEQVEVWKG